MGPHRSPRGARSGALPHLHRRRARHGLHALRRAFGIPRRPEGWRRLTLRFVATRAQDQILITVANGGAFQGKPGSRASASTKPPTPASGPSLTPVGTFGPAYRYPAAGWIYLHIEGSPMSADTSTAISWRARFPSTSSARPPTSVPTPTPPAGASSHRRHALSSAASIAKSWRRCAASPMAPTLAAPSG